MRNKQLDLDSLRITFIRALYEVRAYNDNLTDVEMSRDTLDCLVNDVLNNTISSVQTSPLKYKDNVYILFGLLVNINSSMCEGVVRFNPVGMEKQIYVEKRF